MANKVLGKLLDYIGFVEEDETEEYDGLEASGERFEHEEDVDAVEEVSASNSRVSSRKGKIVNMPSNNTMKMIVFQPSDLADCSSIIDNVKNRKPVVVNFEGHDTESAQRFLDILSGALYALGENLQKISRAIFLLAPSNVDVSGNLFEESRTQSFVDLGSGDF